MSHSMRAEDMRAEDMRAEDIDNLLHVLYLAKSVRPSSLTGVLVTPNQFNAHPRVERVSALLDRAGRLSSKRDCSSF